MVSTILRWVGDEKMSVREREHAAYDIEAKAETIAEAGRVGFFEHLENLFAHPVGLTMRDLA